MTDTPRLILHKDICSPLVFSGTASSWIDRTRHGLQLSPLYLPELQDGLSPTTLSYSRISTLEKFSLGDEPGASLRAASSCPLLRGWELLGVLRGAILLRNAV